MAIPRLPYPGSIEIFLLSLALTLRNMRKGSGPQQDPALDVTDAIQNRLDALQERGHLLELHPAHLQQAKEMTQHLVGLVMNPELSESDLDES